MERRVCRSLCLAAACAVLLALPAQAQDTDKQFTGSWVHYLNATGGANGPFLPALMTFHSDGTMTGSSSLMFGSPAFPLATITYSPIHAVWEKAGPKSIAVTSLFFAFELDGRAHSYTRNRIVLELGKDRDTYTGMLYWTSCTAVPLVCSAVPTRSTRSRPGLRTPTCLPVGIR